VLGRPSRWRIGSSEHLRALLVLLFLAAHDQAQGDTQPAPASSAQATLPTIVLPPLEAPEAVPSLDSEPSGAVPTAASLANPPDRTAMPPELAARVSSLLGMTVDTPGPRLNLDAAKVDPGVVEAACATCGETLHRGVDPLLGDSHGCAGGVCVPGRPPCYPLAEPSTFIGHLINNLYECLCCPDPCYKPRWVPEANAAFFVDHARTRTVTRIRFDRGFDLQFPDRNEYFYKRAILGKFGSSTRPYIVNGRRYQADPSLNFSQLYFYQEVAAGRASVFFDLPSYRQISPLFGTSSAGFSDMTVGTKAMIFDCEMAQLTLQFKTFLPTGDAARGLGTGHVSLEPALLGALRLARQTYLQGQLAQWIPIGGTPDFAGGILHYHFSLNQTLCRVTPDSPLIGTFELNGWSFQNGGYTNPIAGPHQPERVASGGETYFNMALGLRMSVCDSIDFGGALAWPVTAHHWADPLVRLEMRVLY